MVETFPARTVDVLNPSGSVAVGVVCVLQQESRLQLGVNIRPAEVGNTPPEVGLTTLGAIFKGEGMRGRTVSHRVPSPDFDERLVIRWEAGGSPGQHHLGPGQGGAARGHLNDFTMKRMLPLSGLQGHISPLQWLGAVDDGGNSLEAGALDHSAHGVVAVQFSTSHARIERSEVAHPGLDILRGVVSAGDDDDPGDEVRKVKVQSQPRISLAMC